MVSDVDTKDIVNNGKGGKGRVPLLVRTANMDRNVLLGTVANRVVYTVPLGLEVDIRADSKAEVTVNGEVFEPEATVSMADITQRSRVIE